MISFKNIFLVKSRQIWDQYFGSNGKISSNIPNKFLNQAVLNGPISGEINGIGLLSTGNHKIIYTNMRRQRSTVINYIGNIIGS